MPSSPPWSNPYLKAWGESAVPPTALASLILAQSVRPIKPLGLVFPPWLLGASWFNVMGAKADAAGMTAGWSFLYILLSRRSRVPRGQLFSTRGVIRLGTQGMCWGNVAACGYVYVKKKGFRFNNSVLME